MAARGRRDGGVDREASGHAGQARRQRAGGQAAAPQRGRPTRRDAAAEAEVAPQAEAEAGAADAAGEAEADGKGTRKFAVRGGRQRPAVSHLTD